MNPLKMLTQGLALQSTLQPPLQAPGQPDSGQGNGLQQMLQELEMATEMQVLEQIMHPGPSQGGGIGGLEQQLQQLEMMQLLQRLGQQGAPEGGAQPGQPAGLAQGDVSKLPVQGDAQDATSPPQGGEAAPAGGPAGAPAAPACKYTDDPQTVMNGDATHFADPGEKCPDNVSMADMKAADDKNGGLLAKLGNQEIRGAGAKGLTGGIKDNLAKISGGKDGSQIFQDTPEGRDITWRAMHNAQAMKNIPGADGQPLDKATRSNGNMSGFQPSHEICPGSDLAMLQDKAKDPNFQLPQQRVKDSHMNDHDGETSGAQQFGQKILDGFSKVAGFFKSIVDNTIGKIPGIGHIFSAPMDMIAGGISDGLHAAADAAGGHMQDARDDAKQMAHNELATVSQAVDQASGLLKETVGKIPGIGKLLAAGGEVLDSAIVGTTNVLDTGLKGGDMGEAAKNMGKNLGGAALGAVTGLVDPTGVVSGMAEKGLDDAIGAKPQVVTS